MEGMSQTLPAIEVKTPAKVMSRFGISEDHFSRGLKTLNLILAAEMPSLKPREIFRSSLTNNGCVNYILYKSVITDRFMIQGMNTSKKNKKTSSSALNTLSTKTSFFDDKETGLISSHASTRTEDLLAEIMEVENVFSKTKCAGCGTKKPGVPEEDVIQKKTTGVNGCF